MVLFSCNPVKVVLRDEAMFNQVAEMVIRRGLCINDTTVITETRDSIVYKDSIIERISSIPCKDFDTTVGRARITVSSGVLTYSTKDSVVYKYKTKTNIVRDRALEGILRRDLLTKDSIIYALKTQVEDEKKKNKELSWSLTGWKIRFWFWIVAALVIIFRKPLTRIVRGFI